MKAKTAVFLIVALVLVAITVPVSAGNPETGNGAPSGPHYNLNIIGVPSDKNPPMDNNNGHRIFVPLDAKGTKILLTEGPDFEVLDANATDGPAEFQLPLPGVCFGLWVEDDFITPNSCTVRYTVWIRPVGKPTGWADMYTCFDDADLGTICSDEDWWVELSTRHGKSSFTNVSKQLLFVSADVDEDGKLEHVQIFDPAFDSYFWTYDNYGLKLAQMRFYMGEYTINW